MFPLVARTSSKSVGKEPILEVSRCAWSIPSLYGRHSYSLLIVTFLLSRFGAAILVVKTSFGLGVLGIPTTFAALGFFPGLLCLLILSIVSTLAGWYIGRFRLHHPSVHSIGDVGFLLFGEAGRGFLGVSLWLFYTLSYGSGALATSIAFNSITDHATCTMVWVVVAAIIAFVIGSMLRTLKSLVWLGSAAIVSVFLAVWIAAIASLVLKRPAAAPAYPAPVDLNNGPFASSTSFAAVMAAISTQLFSLCGTASFFQIHSEMRDHRQWTKSLCLGQGFVCLNYIATSVIIYAKVGQYVPSPLLGVGGEVVKKVAYGIALPALLYTCIFQAHIAAKYAFVRILRNTRHLQSSTKIHWLTWVGSMTAVCIFGFIVACAVPFFGGLLGLIGALLGTTFMITVPALMYLYDAAFLAKGSEHGLRYKVHTWLRHGLSSRPLYGLIAIFFVVAGLFITVASTYGSIDGIVESFETGSNGAAFSCANNAGS